jgi:predicted ABC-type ATPase
MLERLHSLAEQNRSFAFESTLASRSYAPWLTHLKQKGYKVHVLFLWLRSPELALYRVKERARMGGHDVPESVVRRRYLRGVRNLFHLYQPLADTWTIFDNSDAPSPRLVATGHGSTAIDIVKTQIWNEIKEAAR